MTTTATRGNHAIVIGAGIAGLVAGRVLADHFDTVTILERDRLPDTPVPRKGVPQAHHVHILLARGLATLEQLFPGLSAELMLADVPFLDAGEDFAWLTRADWTVRFHAGIRLIGCTRECLEWTVRRRLAAFANLHIRDGSEVTALITDGDARRAIGLTIRERDGSGAPSTNLYADLIVDASGRPSRAPRWLEALGYRPPEETVVNAFLGYASRLYRRPVEASENWRGLIVQSAPPSCVRAGYVLPVEGDRWMVTLAGAEGDYPPTDEAGFLAFAHTLRSPLVHQAIERAEPLSSFYGHRNTENRWRHYERLDRLPEGFIALGDAVCAFNPVYGQGMTVAALSAVTLDRTLRERQQSPAAYRDIGITAHFQKRLARLNELPWQMATSEDYRFRSTVGGSPTTKTRILQWYLDRVLTRTADSPRVRRRVLEVMHMIRPARALLHPKIMVQALWS
jgi:2-polyprenyl-6-methoxyphenol hydroxylase-like FAD-dependent oxidoreductase